MGSVQQAVLEFDEEVQAPWRPRLVDAGQSRSAFRAPAAHPSRRSPSRVGVCRPPVGPSVPARRPAIRPGTALTGPASPRVATRRPAAAASARRARLRLTRRARRLVVVLALAGAVAVGSWLGPLLGGDGGDLRLAGISTVTVQPGDTLWSIASSLDGDRDVRALVDEIQHLNDLAGVDLMPGQTLQLP